MSMNQQFFIQNTEKCNIYDDDVFIENKADCLSLLDAEVQEIILLSRKGSLGEVKALLDVCPPQQKANLINAGEIWTDGRTGDTALSAAAKEGHLHTVGTLLIEGADPTIENSNLQGSKESARRGVEGKIKYLEKLLNNIVTGKHFIFDQDAWTESEDVIEGNLEKLRKLRKCLNLIKMVEKYWKRKKPKLKVIEKIQAKVLNFLNKKDDLDHQQREGSFSVKKLVKSYQKLLLEKRIDLLGHRIRQKKNFASWTLR